MIYLIQVKYIPLLYSVAVLSRGPLADYNWPNQTAIFMQF